MYNGVYDQEQYAYLYDSLTKWLKLWIQGESLGEAMRKKGIETVAIYGVKGLGEMIYQDLAGSGIKVVCFVDKNQKNCGMEKDGISIFPLEEAEKVPKDVPILVTPEFYFREIMEDLSNRKVALERILSFSMLL